MSDIHQHCTQESIRDLIGIPYEDKDCYELAKEFYRIEFKCELDLLYDVRPTEKQTMSLFNAQKEKFVRVDVPQKGDIIVFNVVGLPCHIGIYLNKETFLHTRQHTGSVIERFSRWHKRVEGYYRWPKSKLE